MARHTKGPWLPAMINSRTRNIVPRPPHFRCLIVGGGNGQVVGTAQGETREECAANVALQAAAPDMLMALILTTERLEMAIAEIRHLRHKAGEPEGDVQNEAADERDEDVIAVNRALLAKAEGR